MLKPQDIAVCVALVDAAQPRPGFAELARGVGLSASETHAAVRRSIEAGLIDREKRTVRRRALLEFLVHGVKYAFAPRWRGVTRGIPTAHAAPPLSEQFAEDELPPVWPDARGERRGQGLDPLYRSAPRAALANAELYEWLALIDALRAGRARERALAEREVTRRLST
jgi:DNA-binding Lrp family transcriptional regulator